MTYVLVLFLLLIAIAGVGAWLVYNMTDGIFCDNCGRRGKRSEQHFWIQHQGHIWCSGDCYRTDT